MNVTRQDDLLLSGTNKPSGYDELNDVIYIDRFAQSTPLNNQFSK